MLVYWRVSFSIGRTDFQKEKLYQYLGYRVLTSEIAKSLETKQLEIYGKTLKKSHTHRIHVWYIYLHLVDFYGKCRHIYHTWMVWDMNHQNK